MMDWSHVAKSILEDALLSRLAALAAKRGVPLFVVGGTIRDLCLGSHRGNDYDLALPPEASFFIPEIEDALGFHFFMLGDPDSGTATYRVIKPGVSVDLTFLQGETIDRDLLRRDFTVNAIAFSLADRSFHWVEGAPGDMARRVIRTVTDRAIDQDPLRMLRAIRYLASLDGFELDSSVSAEISLKRKLIEKVPAERVKMELDKILLSRRRTLGMDALHASGLLLALFPEMEGLESLDQGPYHHLDALSHTLLALEKISWALQWLASRAPGLSLSEEDRLSLCYAALFHDLGKHESRSQGTDGVAHFYQHEVISARAAEKAMDRLRFPARTKDDVLHLVENHMTVLNLSPQTKEPALKKLVNRSGAYTPLLVVLALADKEAARGSRSVSRDETIEAHCARIIQLYGQEEIVHPPSLVTGHDVMALGVEPGRRVGQLLQFIREKQVLGEIRTREEALKALREEALLP